MAYMELTPAGTTTRRILWFVCLLLVLASGYLGYSTWTLLQKVTALRETVAERDTTIATAQRDIQQLIEALDTTRTERDTLSTNLSDEKEKNAAFEEQIADISGTVGKLDKLAQTDPELLRKYSKVYFLNENYEPVRLTLLDKKYAYDESREFYLHKEVLPFFEDMVDDAKDDGVDLFVNSAFRSFETQSDLKSTYSVTYGSGANAFSADQGYSEHQLGTTVDFTTTGIDGGLNEFGTTEAYQWLLDNAHKYGFVLSYPENNSYYIFEPWHWRFVGRDLARDLHRKDQHFYDLTQRDLNEYLISIFD